jgi:hypothetical protein
MSEKTFDDELKEATQHLAFCANATLRDFLVVLHANTEREGDKLIIWQAVEYYDRCQFMSKKHAEHTEAHWARERALKTRQRELLAEAAYDEKEGDGSDE